MNDRTVILHVRRDFKPDLGELTGAEQVKEMARLRAEQPALPASAIFVRWRDDDTTAQMTRLVHHPFGVEAPVALVAGRHSECDLGSIPGASLRHALILLWPPAGEAALPLAEVLDLGTQTGIALADGRFAMRVASRASIRVGIASADVVIVHAPAGEPLLLEPGALSKLLRETPERAEVTPHANQPYTRHLDIGSDVQAGSRPDARRSCVAVPVASGQDRTFGSEHLMLTQMISFGGGGARAKVRVREKDLKRGVRLGRYLRCRGASVLGRDEHVSRVHALVLDRGGHRWLFDTASTNGTAVVDVDTGIATGPVRGNRTFALLEGQAPALAGQVALLDVGVPDAPS